MFYFAQTGEMELPTSPQCVALVHAFSPPEGGPRAHPKEFGILYCIFPNLCYRVFIPVVRVAKTTFELEVVCVTGLPARTAQSSCRLFFYAQFFAPHSSPASAVKFRRRSPFCSSFKTNQIPYPLVCVTFPRPRITLYQGKLRPAVPGFGCPCKAQPVTPLLPGTCA